MKEELKKVIQKHRNEIGLRAVVVYLVESGLMGAKEVAKWLGIGERTIYTWKKRWKEEGEEGLSDKRAEGNKGKRRKLSEEDEEKLKEMLKKKEYWTTREVMRLIKEKFGVEYSYMGAYKLMRRIGMKYVKPMMIDERKPEGAEDMLREAVRIAIEELEGVGIDVRDIAIGFLDETSPQMSSNTQRVWSFESRVKIRKRTLMRGRANIIGYYAIQGRSVEGHMERSTGENVAKFLEKIKEANKDRKAIIVILDNFSSHKARVVREKAEELGIKLVYLPPYSPDLNPIEWIWKSVKRAISLINFKSVEELREKVKEIFREKAKEISYAEKWIEKITPAFKYLLPQTSAASL